ncbi:hypothetical protein CBR_g40977 [Chara braunii]|uniref:Coatomer WD associated region domain-containing protein n=1 Tax=Chara braunii TaxID=69332 RepID=A0A388LUY8_CHABU|nr:hypothetical protein CBR_g40977 [Chara braunii]|eukprot:GBG86075.1 hypothetical protein CBR_g40977 [Chara braunii]
MTECASTTHAVAVHHSLPCLLAGFANKDVFLFYWGRKWEKIKLQGHSTAIRAVAFHPTESQIFATASDDDIIKVWNLEERSVVRTLKVAEGVRTLKVAEGSDLNIGACRRGGLISLVSPLESDKKYKMPVDWDRILSPVFCTRIMGFCPRVGKSLLIAFHKETIQVWDYKEGVCMAKWEAHDTPTRSAFFHPRLPYIFTVAKEGKIRIWSETSYRQVASYFFGYADISSMIPCGTCNKLVLGGRGMFKVVAVDIGREEQENEAQKQMQSPSTESAQTSAGATTTGDEAVFALRTPVSVELENRIVQIRLEFEEKIKQEVANVELNCKKALERGENPS